MSAEQDISSSKTTWAVILGASDILASERSTTRLFSYVTRAFSLPNENVLDLFDSEELPANQLRVIAEWLSSKQETLKDLIVFYSGCVSFTPEIWQLFLSTRTTEPWERATSIGIADFSKMLEMNAGRARKYLIFDCVLSSTATLDELRSKAEGRRELLQSNTGVLFLYWSVDKPRCYYSITPFQEELYRALEPLYPYGDAKGQIALSLNDLAGHVREGMFQVYGERPYLHGYGDLASEPFFPVIMPPLRVYCLSERRPFYLDYENIQFTVYRPRAIQLSRWYKMLVFTHLYERPEWLDANEPSPIEQVEEEAERILGPLRESYRKTTDDSRLQVPREGEITFVPSMPGIDFNPPTRSFSWKEGLSVHLETFELRAAPGFAPPCISRGLMTVFFGHLILAEVPIAIRITESSESGSLAREASEASSVRRFRKIFASYSHQDLEIAKEMERYAVTLGDRYLRDWVDLRAGERWDERLLGMITEADVFQLFWSWNSSISPYVEREWRHAFSLNRGTFIRPTYWEDPWPPPPEPLRHIHFQRFDVGRLLESEKPPQPALPMESAPPIESRLLLIVFIVLILLLLFGYFVSYWLVLVR